MAYYMEKFDKEKQHERNIYNASNILLTRDDLFSILDKSGMDYSKIKSKISKTDIKEFQIAFNHKSYCKYNIKISDELEKSHVRGLFRYKKLVMNDMNFWVIQ